MQQVVDDMTSNRFLEATPIAVSFGGVYSGTVGPFLVTYRIANDGTGVSCYYQSGTVVIHQVKIYSQEGDAFGLVHETGTIGVIRLLAHGAYVFESYGQKYKLLPDNDLALANLGCKARLLQTN
jgi:hypothetical protein